MLHEVAAAVYTSSGLAYYRHSDWLGSSRFASTPSRTMYSSTAYAPFGEPYAQAGTADLNFTGMNSDTSGNSYDFLYRQYGTQGRWPSPDPAGLAAVDPSNPQSWNRYAYVLNSPMALTDSLGMVCNPATDNGLAGGDPLANGTGIFTPEDCMLNGGVWDDSGFGFIGGGGSGNGDPAAPPGDPTPGCEPQYDENGMFIGFKCDDQHSSGGGPQAPSKSQPPRPPTIGQGPRDSKQKYCSYGRPGGVRGTFAGHNPWSIRIHDGENQ